MVELNWFELADFQINLPSIPNKLLLLKEGLEEL